MDTNLVVLHTYTLHLYYLFLPLLADLYHVLRVQPPLLPPCMNIAFIYIIQYTTSIASNCTLSVTLTPHLLVLVVKENVSREHIIIHFK